MSCVDFLLAKISGADALHNPDDGGLCGYETDGNGYGFQKNCPHLSVLSLFAPLGIPEVSGRSISAEQMITSFPIACDACR